MPTVAIRCQAVDCARENASTVWRQVATDADRSHPLPSGGLRQGKCLHRLATGGYRCRPVKNKFETSKPRHALLLLYLFLPALLIVLGFADNEFTMPSFKRSC
jgi:hypothetical protein